MRRLPVDDGYRMMYPRLTVLLSAGMAAPNAMAAAWSTPLSFDPPLVGVSVSPKRHTHSLVLEDGAFGVNVPGRDLVDEVLLMGSESGRDVDKFAETGLTVFEGESLGVPLIEECVAAIECELVETADTGDHRLFVGRVETVYADGGRLRGGWPSPDEPVYWRDSSCRDVFGLGPDNGRYDFR